VRIVFTILMFLFLPTWVWGATVYVKDISGTVYYESGAASCDDVTADDTEGDLEAALNATGQDGTLNICSGTYTDTEIDSDHELETTHSGQTIQGVGNPTLTSTDTDVIIVLHDNATFKNFTISDYGDDVNDEGIYIFNNAANIDNTLVDNMVFSNGLGAGVEVLSNATYYSSGVTIQNSTFASLGGAGIILRNCDDCGAFNNIITTVATGNVATWGILVGGRGSEFVYDWVAVGEGHWQDTNGNTCEATEDCEAPETETVVAVWCADWLTKEAGTCPDDLDPGEWCQESGTTIWVNQPRVNPKDVARSHFIHRWVSGNIIRGNIVSGVSETGGDGHGIGCENANDGCLIERNKSYSNYGHGIEACWASKDCTIQNNVVYSNDNEGIRIMHGDSGKEVKLYHNTIYDNGDRGVWAWSYSYSVVKNNIASAHEDGDFLHGSGATIEHTHNLAYGDDEWAGSWVKTANEIENQDPLFISTTDFRLQPDSPAFNAGVNVSVTTDFNGDPRPQNGGYDIGAYEWIWSPLIKHWRIGNRGLRFN